MASQQFSHAWIDFKDKKDISWFEGSSALKDK